MPVEPAKLNLERLIAVPVSAIQPMDLFPGILLLTTILIGLVDSIPRVLLGAWIYRPARRPARPPR